jgi:hypothetical protein
VAEKMLAEMDVSGESSAVPRAVEEPDVGSFAVEGVVYGAAVESAVEDAVESAVEGAVEDAVEGAVEDAVESAVEGAVEDTAGTAAGCHWHVRPLRVNPVGVGTQVFRSPTKPIVMLAPGAITRLASMSVATAPSGPLPTRAFQAYTIFCVAGKAQRSVHPSTPVPLVFAMTITMVKVDETSDTTP